jgi:epoxyqueuosine reductase
MMSHCRTAISRNARADTWHPTPETQDLTSQEVKTEARRLGFDLVGIAAAETFSEAEARLVEWVRRGCHADMGWIDESRARRSCHPDELLPGARSVIVVGAAYSTGREAPPPALHGRVARYARGRDYHDVLKERLWDLLAYLAKRAGPGVRGRVFVDTGPLAEREAAVQAGLGFYGKNTCLLTGTAGSYVLLGAILTDLALKPDAPIVRDCGSCRLCLDACPTGALSAPYHLDARLCISYLTIELRGPIPSELRPKLGAHVFGCDICQDVCPWNHGRGPIPWPEFAGRTLRQAQGRLDEGRQDDTTTVDSPVVVPSSRRPSSSADMGADLELLELLDLDEDAFRERFRGSPIKRAKRRGLLRNAAVALGNSGDRRAVPALARALEHDPDPLVRSHAAWALHQLGDEQAQAALAAGLGREQDQNVRAEIEPEAVSKKTADS